MTIGPRQIGFLQRLGLNTNPFEYTNADDEPLLEQYFVAPPYFDSVYGDPANPVSCMVLAPRGAGKSAQRKMVETHAPADVALCVTYDTFRNPSGHRLVEMTLSDHLLNVARTSVVGIITWMANHPDAARRLDRGEREALRAVALGLLSPFSQAQLREALTSLRNLSDTAKAVWNEHHWVLDAILSSINILSGGPGGGTLPAAELAAATEADPEEALAVIGRAARRMDIRAIYVLVDRVDETQETQVDPAAAYRMISPLMHELRVLEHRPFAYKFFVPDYLLPFYQEAGGRSDRVRNYQTQWNNSELEEMMARRLRAHSDGRVTDLRDLLQQEPDPSSSVRLSLYFAQRSPRDLIRIWGRAVDEQLRMDSTAGSITSTALVAGIDTFCFERAEEVATTPIVRELKRVATVDFTVSEVASDVYHVGVQAARARIQGWENRGVVKQIGEVPAVRGRPQHHYGVVDARVARAMFPDVSLQQFLATKARLCGGCESWMLRDWDDERGQRDETCVECGVPVEPVR
jgi:hypothetical protein